MFAGIAFTAGTSAQSVDTPFNEEYLLLQIKDGNDVKDGQIGNSQSRTPMKLPTIGFDGMTLYLYGQFNDVTLKLLNNGTVEFSTAIPANANEVALPDCTPGTYELQLYDGQFIYYCELEIE